MGEVEAVLGDVHVILLTPEKASTDTAATDNGLALWITHLGGSAADERPTMQRIADRGRAVVSFDPPLHGQRAQTNDPRAFAAEVLAAFRSRMWPILGQATLEAMRVLTWAREQLGQPNGPITAGGVSMGGDIAIAVAGIDDRVRRVAVVGSSPDWRRPGMRSVTDSTHLIDQGRPDRYAQWFADHLNPSQHITRYQDGPPISFELGERDRHIPAAHAEQFARDVAGANPDAASRITINVHPGLDHLAVTTNDDALAAVANSLAG